MFACLAVATTFAGCGGGSTAGSTIELPATEPWQWSLPAGWSPPVVPENNPMNTAKVELGRRLFYDTRLSGNGTQSCASCHAQASAFTDNRALARGSTGEIHPRNAQPLANVAYHSTLNWADPAATTLEQQLLAPLFNVHPVELGVNDGNRDEVLARLRRDPDYPPRFAAAFAGLPEPLSWDHVAKAIAAFERTLISADSRYDRHLAGQVTLTDTETRGMRLFFGDQALCSRCHGSPNFNDQFRTATTTDAPAVFHNTGLFNIGGTGAYPEPNRGVYELTRKITDMGRFRAASLRNIELTAPYMHDGSIGTLEAVLDFYADGGRNVGNGLYAGDGRLNPYKDPLISQIRLQAQDKSDLVAFLKTLTDYTFISNPQFSDPFAANKSHP
ncbi:cytochrome c peroxidase [Comamonas odontotermitis]|uniref:Cytochrome c peroxidase n=1 Tax=Comamonas odontotermitis TaxID=379895 RepID=A0ABR6RD78_9BURK|nr:methanobactin export MATE transporter MbnM [Comamonas odontotermitis]MBB6576984.1 cytochrome c peroxidase [Comamonas odontotermitis]